MIPIILDASPKDAALDVRGDSQADGSMCEPAFYALPNQSNACTAEYWECRGFNRERGACEHLAIDAQACENCYSLLYNHYATEPSKPENCSNEAGCYETCLADACRNADALSECRRRARMEECADAFASFDNCRFRAINSLRYGDAELKEALMGRGLCGTGQSPPDAGGFDASSPDSTNGDSGSADAGS